MIELAKTPGMGKRCRVGQIVAVTFLDHSEDHSEPITFTVYGRAARNTRTHVCVDSWEYTDQEAPYDTNEKRFSIVRTAISGIEVLKDCPRTRKR